jgi:hypothetical protein
MGNFALANVAMGRDKRPVETFTDSERYSLATWDMLTVQTDLWQQ